MQTVIMYLPQGAWGLIDECFVIRTDVWVVYRGENAHLIESVFFFFVWQFAHLYFLECIDLPVNNPMDVVYTTVGALAFKSKKKLV